MKWVYHSSDTTLQLQSPAVKGNSLSWLLAVGEVTCEVRQSRACSCAASAMRARPCTTDTVCWADIPRGLLWRHSLSTGDTDSCQVREPVGSVCLTANGRFVVAAWRGFSAPVVGH